MKNQKPLKSKIAYRIKRSGNTVFFLSDFKDLAGRDQTMRALRGLIAEGSVARIGYGLYVRTRISKYTGKVLLEKRLWELAKDALQRLGVKAEIPQLELDYIKGESDQIPTGRCFFVGKSRIARKIEYGNSQIYYDRTSRKAAV